MEVMKEKIFVTHQLPGKYLERLNDEYEVVVWSKRDISREDLLKSVEGVVGIVALLTEKIDGEVMDRAGKQLRVISNYAVGFDNIDLVEATKRGIVVTNTPGVLTESVAEMVIALSLALLRRVAEGDRFIRAGKYKGWEPDLVVGTGLRDKVMGIVGMGRIGRWTGRLAEGMGMKVIYYSHSRDEEYETEVGATYHSLEKLLTMADVVSLSVPLGDETRGMLGAVQFKLMKPTAILVNTSRGAVVKEKELIEALKEGEIAGAALDVFNDEENVPMELRRMENVVLTPHIASATIESRLAMARLVVESLTDGLAGRKPETIVNCEVWEKK
jgi:glyoxylate reductase